MTDMKVGIDNNGAWTAEYYEATVVSAVDYYPFGSAMAGRKYNQGTYRFGFNGKEEDSEWGSQMIQDYGFRIYNPTIGKFLSVDPLTQSFPWFTPYQFASNTPIAAIDLDGLEAASGVAGVQNIEAIDGVRLKLSVDFGLYDQNAAQVALHHKSVSENIDFTIPQNNDVALMVGETILGTLLPPAGWALDAKDFYAAYSEGDGWGMFFSGVGFLPFGDLAKNGYKVIKVGTKISVEATGNAKALGKMTLKEGKDIRAGKKIKICQGCFTGEVKVKTEFGYKPIKDIKVGDKVWAYNDTTKTLELKSVVRTIKLDFNQLYKISFGDDYVNATYEHPFYTSKGWKDAEDLRLGDSLFVYGEKWVVISNITYFERPEVVYNFIVEDFHTYFVSEDDILVHNGDPCDLQKVNGRKPRNGLKYGDDTYLFEEGSNLATKYPNGIKFSKRGFPDFSQHAVKTVDIGVLNKTSGTDISKANKKAKLKETPDEMVWHHVENSTILQLIPKDLHDAVKHTGGRATNKPKGAKR